MPKMSLKNLDLNGQRVLMRVDFNVPIKEGKITDDSRIRAAIPSIEYILKQGASLVLMSHLGRPNGEPKPEFSLAPCAQRLEELLQQPVQMAPDCIGPEVEKMDAKILLLENVRFHSAEEHPEQDPSFAEKLAKLGTCYANDAFGSAHRAHSSTTTITRYFPQKSAMGFLMEAELTALTPLITQPDRPFYTILGGAKISSKLGVVKKMLDLVDKLFIGGAMAYTFMKAKGICIGESPSEDPKLIQDLLMEKIRLPEDLIIADAFTKDANTKVINAEEGIPPGWQGVDLGPKTIHSWSEELQTAATVFWNGPLGVFELPPFSQGTRSIATSLSKMSAKVIIGGGDSLAAIEQAGLSKKFTHLSTGGGASLEFLEYGHLPGIDALSDVI